MCGIKELNQTLAPEHVCARFWKYTGLQLHVYKQIHELIARAIQQDLVHI